MIQKCRTAITHFVTCAAGVILNSHTLDLLAAMLSHEM